MSTRCVDGACAPVDVLDLELFETATYASGANPSVVNTAQVCGTLKSPVWTPDLPPPLGAEGACKVWSYDLSTLAPAPIPQRTSPGQVKVTTPTGMFFVPTMGTACAVATPMFALFAKSGVTSFDGDGTGHFPEFHLELTPPAAVELVAEPVVRGQPLHLTWQAADSEGVAIELRTMPNPGSIVSPPWLRCELPDTGSYIIPASLTTLLDLESDYADLVASRRTHSAAGPSNERVILASVTRSDQLLLDYTP